MTAKEARVLTDKLNGKSKSVKNCTEPEYKKIKQLIYDKIISKKLPHRVLHYFISGTLNDDTIMTLRDEGYEVGYEETEGDKYVLIQW